MILAACQQDLWKRLNQVSFFFFSYSHGAAEPIKTLHWEALAKYLVNQLGRYLLKMEKAELESLVLLRMNHCGLLNVASFVVLLLQTAVQTMSTLHYCT